MIGPNCIDAEEKDMTERNQESFWGVWKEGFEWPQLLADETVAKGRALRLGKECVGQTVYLLKFEVVGTIEYPESPKKTGKLAVV